MVKTAKIQQTSLPKFSASWRLPKGNATELIFQPLAFVGWSIAEQLSADPGSVSPSALTDLTIAGIKLFRLCWICNMSKTSML